LKIINIEKNDAGQRIDKFLTKILPDLPESLLNKYIRKKEIKINNKSCKNFTKINQGDVLKLYIKNEFFENFNNKNYNFLKAPNKLNIIYEDENILLVDKKPGLLVHSDEKYHFDNLIYRIQNYLYKKQEYLPEKENSFTPALVNRIDRNTSGIVIAAKNFESLKILNKKLKDREIRKFYLCIIHGYIKKKTGILTGYLNKNEEKNKVYINFKPDNNSKIIKTKYKILAEKNNLSLVEVELLTGRTHQIRAHFAAINHPILGDKKYGNNFLNKNFKFKYRALSSYKLIFNFKNSAGALDYLNNSIYTIKNIELVDYFNSLKET